MLIFAWLYYSSLYIVGSIIITLALNKVVKKLYLSPLIINMISVILLLISKGDRTYSMYFIYVPVVLASSILNVLIYIIKRRG